MSARDTTLTAFTPDAMSLDVLRTITVGRTFELGSLRDAFRAAASSGARPNLLVVGPRGSGKTHLLTLAEAEVRGDTVLARSLTVVRLPEELYAVTSYGDLLANTILQLAHDGGWAGSANSSVDDRIALALSRDDHLSLERTLLDALDGRVLVWMIENFDRVLKVLGIQGQHLLRAFLHNHGRAVLVATTPALFWGVSNHDAPLYGAFRVLPLGELTVDEGRELLLRVARMQGDDELERYLASARSLRRLHAVADLAGGLPRLWHLLAGCMTVELLDELVPLFIRLLDQLTPYYKARLDELSPAKAKLTVYLCRANTGAAGRRPVGALTVTELARTTGMSNQAASKQLGELERARFVRARKLSGGDQRTTYYEVSEPLLRHCLELKESRGQPLALIVAALRDWHDTAALRQALVGGRAGSSGERYLMAAMEWPGSRGVAGRPDRTPHGLYGTDNPADLLHEARRAAASGVAAERPHTWLAAVVAEVAVLSEWDGTAVATAAYGARITHAPGLGTAVRRAVITAATMPSAPEPGRDRPMAEVAGGIASRLLAAADRAESEPGLPLADQVAVRLLVASWLEQFGRAGDALPMLERLTDVAACLDDSRLRLQVADQLAIGFFYLGQAHDATAQAAAAEAECHAQFGPDDPFTLSSRHTSAFLAGTAGDAARARDLFAALVEDLERVLGPDDDATLAARHNLGHWTARAGDLGEARELFAGLIDDRTRVLGADHRRTLRSRWWLATLLGKTGDYAGARDLLTDLAGDQAKVLGAGHWDTLSTRLDLARSIRDAGNPADAHDRLVDLVEDMAGASGRDPVLYLDCRSELARSTKRAGDYATTRDLLAAIVVDEAALHAPDDQRSLVARNMLAIVTGAAGDAALARDMLSAVVSDAERVLGADNPDAITARSNLAHWTAQAGDAVRALNLLDPERAEQFQTAEAVELVNACLRLVAEPVIATFGVDQATAGARLAESVRHLDRSWHQWLVAMILTEGASDAPFRSWFLDRALEVGLADLMTIALATASSRLEGDRAQFLGSWVAATAGRKDPEYQLAHRVVAAAHRLLDGHDDALLALAPEERIFARAAAGLGERPT